MQPTPPSRTAPDQAPADLPEWRKALRVALINQRMAVGKETLAAWRQAMDRNIERGFPGLAGAGTPAVVAICWPYRNEYDARHVAAQLRRAGATIALPVVVAPQEPLAFREWHPGTKLAAGPLGIPYPAEGPELSPTAALLPMAGFDSRGYRLGYGGGYFDRTFAAMQRRPLLIGVAHELARVPTIHPQLHDIPMDYVVTEAGVYRHVVDSHGDLHGSRLEFLGAPAAARPSFAAPEQPGDVGGRPNR